jgi:peroxiredoxin
VNTAILVVSATLICLFLCASCWLSVQLLRQSGRVLLRLDELEQRLSPAGSLLPLEPPSPAGLPVGSPAPEFELPDLSGERKSLAQFRGRKVLLVLFNPGCGFCVQMAPDLAALPADGAGGQPVPLVVSSGEPEETRKLVEEHGIRCPVLLQAHAEVSALFEARGTPVGYLIDEDGNIASELAMGAPALLALVDQTGAPTANGNGHGPLGGKRSLADSKIPRNGLPAGTPAPDFTLPRMDGGELTLEEYRGRKVLLVLSDPNCGPCDLLAPQLEQQYRVSPEVQVVMVSRGNAETNRAKAAKHGLTFPIGLQRQWEVSRQFSMFATPVGYLVDEHGIIAADVATGADAILALLSRPAGAAEAPDHRCRCGKLRRHCGCGQHLAEAWVENKAGR